MSAPDQEYKKEYNRKYYRDNKELLADKRKEASKRRSRLLNIVYRLWRQGKLAPVDAEAHEELTAELAAVDKKDANIVFEDENEDEDD